MTEINSLGTQSAIGQTAGKAAMTGELLRLLQSQSPLAAGESAKAEVMSLRQVGQDFQMLLRLTLANGAQAQVQASGNQPLPQGSQLLVSQPLDDSLSLLIRQGSSSQGAPLSRLDTSQLPVGTLLQGKVVTSQLAPRNPGEAPTYRALVSLLNGSQVGTTLNIDSPRALPIGSLLTALVQDDRSLRFVPLSGRQDQLAIAQQLLNQQSRQASLGGLLGALRQLQDSPGPLRATAERLLAGLPDARQLGDAKGVAQALSNSGAFLEAKLLGGLAGGIPADFKGQLGRLVAQLPPGVPGNPLLGPAAAAGTLAQTLPGFVRQALGMLGQVGPRPQPGSFPLPSRLLQSQEGEGDLEHLLRLAAAAISRVQSHQLASLQQTGIAENGNLQTTWQTELPVRQGPDFVPLQVKLQREETPRRQDDPDREPRDPLKALWRIELAFDLPPIGPLQVQAQLSQGKLSGQLWAERAATARLIDSQLGELRQRLLQRGLDVGDLACHTGTPPQGPTTRVEQRWVDETA